MTKKQILIFCAYYLPGYKAGGPIRSVANIVQSLSDEYEFYIVTKDRDAFDQESYPKIAVNEWNEVGKAHVFYTSPNISYKQIKILLNERYYHRLYLNSFFSIQFSVVPLLLNIFNGKKSAKTILAPRGEFSEGALELKSIKKKLFVKVVSFFNIHKNITWQATSLYEKADIKKALNVADNNILVASNIPQICDNGGFESKFSGLLKIVFISRVSPKKNLVYALEVLNLVKCNVEFNIFGVIDDELYWKRCEEIIKTLPANVQVNYFGSISNDKVSSTLSNNHLFFLPTKGENYGHAIVEAFMAGIPVLISDTTPWRDLEMNGVGWEIPLKDKLKYVKVIEKVYIQLSENIFSNREDIQKWILNEIDFKHTIEMNKKLFI